jgi:hypothetical protein
VYWAPRVKIFPHCSKAVLLQRLPLPPLQHLLWFPLQRLLLPPWRCQRQQRLSPHQHLLQHQF